MNIFNSYFPYVVALLMLSSAIGANSRSAGSSLNANTMSLLRSSYRDQYQRNLQQLKQSHQETVREIINAVQLQLLAGNDNGKDMQRQIQSATMAPTDFSLCNSDGTINFDDDFNVVAFDSSNIFDTMCKCIEESNIDLIVDQISKLNRSDIPTYVSMFNKLIGEGLSTENISCRNNCESCFIFGTDKNQTCGLLSSESIVIEQLLEGNFTFEEITTGDGPDLDTIDASSYYTNDCIDYKTAPYTGKLCLTVDLKGIPSENDTLICNITYNDDLCNSCVIPPGDSDECVMADCTNIDPDAMINACENTGLVGPFQYFGFLSISDSVDNTTFTPGTCSEDGGSVPGETPVAIPVGQPVRAPARAPTTSTSDSCYSRLPSMTTLTLLSTFILVTFM